MRRFELPYQVSTVRKTLPLKLVCAFPCWAAYEWTGFEKMIWIDDFSKRRVIVFKYDARSEMNDDLELLRRLNGDDGEAAGAPAWLRPVPPSRAATEACTFRVDSAA